MFGGTSFAATSFATGPGFLYGVVVSESVDVADQNASPQAVFNSTVVESTDVAELLSTTFEVNATVIDAALVVDENSSLVEFSSAVREAVSVDDDVSVVVDFVATTVDGVDVTDTYRASSEFISVVQESVSNADRFISRLLWEVINTAEAGNWVVEGNAQLELQVTVGGGGFSSGAISSGPISGLGGSVSLVVVATWNNVNSAGTTNWDVVETQT